MTTIMLTMNTNDNTKFIFKCIQEKNNFFVIYFLKHNHDSLDIVDEKGNNMVMNIIKYGTNDMIKFMMNKYGRLDLNIIDDVNIHALFYIVQNKSLELDYLRSFFNRCNADINMINDSLGSLLFCAIQHRNIYAITYMLAMNIDANNTCNNGEPVIFHSVANGLLEISNSIINHNTFDIDKTNSAGESILEVSLLKNMVLHSNIILSKRPSVVRNKNKVVKMMGICVEKQNTALAFKLYQNYLAFIIQRAMKKYIIKLKAQNNSQTIIRSSSPASMFLHV
jgi:hypothetical protein